MIPTIGILGGMGPEAGAHMLTLIFENTKADTDQDHIPILLNSNPKVPPRTDAILGNGPSPLPFLVGGLKILKQAGFLHVGEEVLKILFRFSKKLYLCV